MLNIINIGLGILFLVGIILFFYLRKDSKGEKVNIE